MIEIYKLIKGITVKHKVGSNYDNEMVSQFSSSSPIGMSCLKQYIIISSSSLNFLEKHIVFMQLRTLTFEDVAVMKGDDT